MRFSFTEDQLLFRDAVRDFLEKECDPPAVRAAWASETGRSPERWRKLADLGVVGLTVPEQHGGLGLDEIDLVLVLEESGRAALPEPLVETAAVGAPLLRDAGVTDWLPRIAAGDAIVTVGFAPGAPVADAHVADVLVLAHGGELHAVGRDQVTLEARPVLDAGRRLFGVDWKPSRETRLATGDGATVLRKAAFDRGALAASAQLVGIADRLIALAAEHARQREQFGKPIGSFQAVKHLLADALLAVDFARPVVYRAAWSVARDVETRARDVSMAKAYASDAATAAARRALQVHGAIGYTWEHDLHLWMKRAWSLSTAWGDAGWQRARLLGQVDW